jgi:hypothetical protein
MSILHTFLEERGLSIHDYTVYQMGSLLFPFRHVFPRVRRMEPAWPASMSILMMSKTDMTSCHSNMLSYIKIEIYLTRLYGCVATAVSGAKCSTR